MNVLKKKLLTNLLAFGLVITSLVGLAQYYTKPLCSWGWFFATTSFFLVLEFIIILYVESISRINEKKKLVNAYMLTKVVKIILSLILVTIYALVVRENIKEFVILFVLFYFLYLIVEAILFIKIEKHIKETQSNDK